MGKLFISLCTLALTFNVFASESQVNQVLNSFHKAAANADGESYFSLLAENSTFIGTDIKETWSKAQFQNYAMPYFNKGQGWKYVSRERHIYFNSNKDTAWFDELLFNKSLGNTRGSGVLEKQNGKWLITQYHLTVPIPNEIVDDVALQIKNFEKQQNTLESVN
jgi:hypothetical protein